MTSRTWDEYQRRYNGDHPKKWPSTPPEGFVGDPSAPAIEVIGIRKDGIHKKRFRVKGRKDEWIEADERIVTKVGSDRIGGKR